MLDIRLNALVSCHGANGFADLIAPDGCVCNKITKQITLADIDNISGLPTVHLFSFIFLCVEAI